ncbi:MAG: hypothetical protein GXP43_03340 [bacterium]|nr:hypothetical protein [bacterium]
MVTGAKLVHKETGWSWSFFSLVVWLSGLTGMIIGFILFQKIVSSTVGGQVSYRWLVPPRGLITDRKGNLLVENRPFYFFQNQWVSYQDLVFELEERGMTEEESRMLVEKLPLKYVRYYPYDPESSGVLGYVSEASKDELLRFGCRKDDLEGYCLVGNEYVGRFGVELVNETRLQGLPGLVKGGVLIKPVKPGRDVAVTIDLDLQKKVAELVKSVQKPVGVLVMNTSGEVLSLVSYPWFEANVFSGGRLMPEKTRTALIDQMLAGKDKLLINRVYQAAWPPGSVFKLVVAMAGLETGVIDKNTLIEDTGFIRVGKYVFRNWYWTKYGRREGRINVIKAISRSNDVFFYKLGEKVGAEQIGEYAGKFGFGAKVSKDFASEDVGVVPSPKQKLEKYGERWFLGNTYHLSIGQGDLLASTAQVARMTLILANNGQDVEVVMTKRKQRKAVDLGFKQRNVDVVKEGMRLACRKGGTAFVFFNFPVEVGCKTGTAENDKGEPHAWFSLFAPFDKPKYVIAVMVENGGEGSYVAAPIAKEILKYLLAIQDDQ